MATIFQVFDLKEAAALSEAKPQARERRYLDGGFEAPRNSLDVPNFEAADVSRSSLGSSIFKPDDIPFGYEYYNPALAASMRRPKKGGASHSLSLGNSPSRKRAPNVVAQLMGLEALPDEPPAVPTRKFSQPGTPTYGSPKLRAGGNPGLTRQRSQGAVPSSWQRPPLPRQVQRAPAAIVEEERVLAPVLPFRDHPQEEQLQKFKKEFEAKQQASLAKKQEQLRTLQLENMNRELEEKKEKVRATLDKAKSALSQQGIVTAEPKRLNGQAAQFEESKEFLDAMKFLESNKDFIFQFLQQKPSEVACSNENSNATTPVARLKSAKKGQGSSASSPRDCSVRKRDGFSPRALARLFMNPRKWNHDSKQQPATSSASNIVPQSSAGAQPVTIDRCNGSGSRRASTEEREMLDDVKLRTSSSTNSRSELRAPPSLKVQSKPPRDEVNSQNKSGAGDVIGKIKERLRQREQCDSTGEELEKERLQGFLRDSNDIARKIAKNAGKSSQKNNFTVTEYLSTGKRVSMHTEDMDDVRYTSDGEELSTPLVTIVRENATRRSSISLPSSPHLSARSGHDVATSSRAMRKRATEKPGTPPANPSNSAATLKEAKKTTLTSESPRRNGSQTRGSLLSNTEVEKSLRKSASVNENASRSEALKQRVEASAATSRRCSDQNKEEPASNLTRCRSIPNVALLRKREQCSSEAVQNIGSRRGVRQSDKFSAGKSTAKTSPKQMLGQKAEKTKGFFSGGRKKVRDGSEAMPSALHLLFPSTTPVLSRFAALAESCVSQSNTLSDADNAVDVKLHVRASRNYAGAKKGKENPWPAHILPSKKEITYPQFDKVFQGEPSPAEAESVVSESSADSDANSCDGEFLEVLSHLPPLAKSGDTGEALPSTVCVSRVQQQIQSFKKSPKPLRAWTTLPRDIPNKVDDYQDSSNSDNNGQPSPVSVLEAPFEEESPGLEFKETANGLHQGLRIRLLRHLEVEGGNSRIEEDLEHSETSKADLEHVSEIADTPMVSTRHQFLDSTRENQTLANSLQHKTNTGKRRFATTEITNLQENFLCPAGHEADLAFVTNVLVGSDFITHGGRLISKWHSAMQPISPHLFANLDSDGTKGSSENRRVLFDSTNEILAEKLRPQCHEPWSLQLSATAVRTGRRLVEDVWNEISKRQFPNYFDSQLHSDDYLESLVAQDLKTSTAWMSLHHDVNSICLQLEKAIFNDLITELCRGLLIIV